MAMPSYVGILVLSSDVGRICVGNAVDGSMVSEVTGMSVGDPVELEVAERLGSCEMSVFIEGLMVGTKPSVGLVVIGVDVDSNVQPATSPSGTSHANGHGSPIAQHPRYIPPQKL